MWLIIWIIMYHKGQSSPILCCFLLLCPFLSSSPLFPQPFSGEVLSYMFGFEIKFLWGAHVGLEIWIILLPQPLSAGTYRCVLSYPALTALLKIKDSLTICISVEMISAQWRFYFLLMVLGMEPRDSHMLLGTQSEPHRRVYPWSQEVGIPQSCRFGRLGRWRLSEYV